MKWHISLRALAVILLSRAGTAAAETPTRVTILYDSFGKNPALTLDWGFAALVEYGGMPPGAFWIFKARTISELLTRLGLRASISGLPVSLGQINH